MISRKIEPRFERFAGVVDDLDGQALEQALMVNWLARKIFGDLAHQNAWMIRPVRRVRHPFLDGRYLMHLVISRQDPELVDPESCKHIYVDHTQDFHAWFGRRMALDLLKAEGVVTSRGFSAWVVDGSNLDPMLCDPWDPEIDAWAPMPQAHKNQPMQGAVR